jgi:hypothetical protein
VLKPRKYKAGDVVVVYRRGVTGNSKNFFRKVFTVTAHDIRTHSPYEKHGGLVFGVDGPNFCVAADEVILVRVVETRAGRAWRRVGSES